MPHPASLDNAYISPKRKRDAQDPSLAAAPSPSRLRTIDLPTRPFLESDLTGEGSPRTTVAGDLQNLDLDEQNQVPGLDFGKTSDPQISSINASLGSSGFHPQISLPSSTYGAPITPPPSSNGPPTVMAGSALQIEPSHLALEIPETPRLCPVSSPTPQPSATKPKSPPPPTPALWWTDTEITGHNPNDPTDDGYGINGVGFIPTPTIANARAERRKKQVAEWKNREARDARQRRSDRRRKRDSGAANSGTDQEDNLTRPDEGRKVRFLEI
ncbi:hypothetical protein MMC28_005050 [Mycoblastus sanguinarius]|nr:hypothetical protein [Mycoblastus sanguinarius]